MVCWIKQRQKNIGGIVQADIKLQLLDLVDKAIRTIADPDKPDAQKEREALLILDKIKKDIWGMK